MHLGVESRATFLGTVMDTLYPRSALVSYPKDERGIMKPRSLPEVDEESYGETLDPRRRLALRPCCNTHKRSRYVYPCLAQTRRISIAIPCRSRDSALLLQPSADISRTPTAAQLGLQASRSKAQRTAIQTRWQTQRMYIRRRVYRVTFYYNKNNERNSPLIYTPHSVRCLLPVHHARHSTRL